MASGKQLSKCGFPTRINQQRKSWPSFGVPLSLFVRWANNFSLADLNNVIDQAKTGILCLEWHFLKAPAVRLSWSKRLLKWSGQASRGLDSISGSGALTHGPWTTSFGLFADSGPPGSIRVRVSIRFRVCFDGQETVEWTVSAV